MGDFAKQQVSASGDEFNDTTSPNSQFIKL